MALAKAIQTTTEKAEKAMGANPLDAKISKTYFSVSFIALLIGGVLGLLQGLNRAGLLELPAWLNYYQVLTAHGLFLVLVFTTFFVVGYFYAALSHNLNNLLPKVRKMGWTAFSLLAVGAITAAIPVIQGEASVMYTFYPPMAASPVFYIGLVLFVVGIWVAAFGAFMQVANWRKNHKGQHLPILSYFATGVFVLLTFSSIFVAIEVFMIIPWAIGWVDTINVMLARTLFWAFGHTLVNIWYLTAYVAGFPAFPHQ